jgi:histidine ammonia-lyase
VASGRTVYGINTGFGLLAQTRIPQERLAELQRNLVLSHSCGLGEALKPEVVRLVMALKAIGLGRGMSGISRAVVERLLALLAADALPVIPAQGSVGASGDLAPLAHLSAALLGRGADRIGRRGHAGGRGAGAAGPRAAGARGPKEGLALINGTQVSTAIALDTLFTPSGCSAPLGGRRAVGGRVQGHGRGVRPAHPRGARAAGADRRGAGAARAAGGSGIRASHSDCDRVQDPYSFRCQPQVMGAALDLMRQVAVTLSIEANAVTDNPIILARRRCRAAISTPSRWRSRRTSWPWRCARSGLSRSGARRSWLTRR